MILSTEQVARRNGIPVSMLHRWVAHEVIRPSDNKATQPGHHHQWTVTDSQNIGVLWELHRTINNYNILANVWFAMQVAQPTDDVIAIYQTEVKVMPYHDLPRVQVLTHGTPWTIVKLAGH